MNRNVVGWIFVAVQAVILGALILLPRRSDWATPSALTGLGFALIAMGLILVGVASLGLGRALTPTPVPTMSGELTTTGLYKSVRHPIYTGVLAIVVGLTLRSGSFISLAVAVAAVFFFDRKARWEEARLTETYSGYSTYAAQTPRFVPRPWKTK